MTATAIYHPATITSTCRRFRPGSGVVDCRPPTPRAAPRVGASRQRVGLVAKNAVIGRSGMPAKRASARQAVQRYRRLPASRRRLPRAAHRRTAAPDPRRYGSARFFRFRFLFIFVSLVIVRGSPRPLSARVPDHGPRAAARLPTRPDTTGPREVHAVAPTRLGAARVSAQSLARARPRSCNGAPCRSVTAGAIGACGASMGVTPLGRWRIRCGPRGRHRPAR